jgi:hypothetical protein
LQGRNSAGLQTETAPAKTRDAAKILYVSCFIKSAVLRFILRCAAGFFRCTEAFAALVTNR